MKSNNTIAAISTAYGFSGIGVIRISGENVKKLIKEFFKETLKPRYAHVKKIYHQKKILDEVIVIYFKKPNSYTGEDMCEIHSHGNPVILETILDIITPKYARQAKPGEFTERSFLNDKIDLIQAEAVSDLISSSNIEAAKSAANSLQGEFSKQIHFLQDIILEFRSKIESSIDFPEDEIPNYDKKIFVNYILKLEKNLKCILDVATSGSILNQKIRYVIAGKPNAGKSSLINCILNTESSIVSSIPGTTRDSIDYEVKIDNFIISITDTAGLRLTGNVIEKKGIERTKKALSAANRILYIVDAKKGFTKSDKNLIQKYNIKNYDIIYNKIDLVSIKAHRKKTNNHYEIYLSAIKRSGLSGLKKTILNHYKNTSLSENVMLARKRHIECIEKSLEHIATAKKHLQNYHLEFLAEEIRIVHKYVSSVTGDDTITEKTLEKIFSDFCIGK
ncbi:MAG: tRNA uridine-5-carboxymethylaminomethyl(34) synthesis GTPase MnmE [Gammaproteobacteria bacterium]|nr:tRNA uridine-5-carboxymethylaminomethyl(34) synthesis GTPase MnmE [Gammaproteobacteria bacterium]|tara:strand:+ start:3553 stop:4896 length:1344 start_codon:yes stop_codon:yes gene_type:complete